MAIVENSADRRQIKAGKKLLKLEAAADMDAIRWAASSPAGRRALWLLLDACGTFTPLPGAEQAHMLVMSGRRSAGAELFAVIRDAAPEYAGLILVEADMRARRMENSADAEREKNEAEEET